jgi:hypothetical protein
VSRAGPTSSGDECREILSVVPESDASPRVAVFLSLTLGYTMGDESKSTGTRQILYGFLRAIRILSSPEDTVGFDRA